MIKLTNNRSENYRQIFTLFTEELWENQKTGYPKSVQQFFNGKKNEVFSLIEGDSVNYLVGLGKSNFKDFEIQQVAAKFSNSHQKTFQDTATKISAEFAGEHQLEEFIKGLFLGSYKYPFNKEHPFWRENFELHTESFDQNKLDKISETVQALCNGQFAAMDWLNKPANAKDVYQISEFLKNLAQEKNLEYTAFNRKQCEELGLGAFLSVNQGSGKEAAFTILEYKAADENAKTIGLVGKCVLFDTGGISLKNPDNMHYMKSDLGGATAVMGTLIAAAEMKVPLNIVAVLPITDNAISRDAFTPSDVFTAYNGKTIEVLNTDAEGRMTLADGLSYLSKNYKTDVLIDLATLTGSAVRMFGDTCGALFSNNEELKNQLLKSGDETNQRLWNLPLWDIWKDDISSDVADFKNISMKPVGDCIVAAKFLEHFIEGHQNWAHLDIAGVAFGNVNYAKEKAATGYGVQLLLNFIKNYF